MRAIIIAGLAILAAAPAAAAQDHAAETRGHDYAERFCGSCHAVEAGKLSPDPKAPTFESVANTPGMTGTAINVWLHTPHPTMPSLVIDGPHTADLAEYIRSLRKRKER